MTVPNQSIIASVFAINLVHILRRIRICYFLRLTLLHIILVYFGTRRHSLRMESHKAGLWISINKMTFLVFLFFLLFYPFRESFYFIGELRPGLSFWDEVWPASDRRKNAVCPLPPDSVPPPLTLEWAEIQFGAEEDYGSTCVTTRCTDGAKFRSI